MKIGIHRVISGRDFNENHRASTPLELLFDLVYVIAIAAAVEGLHHSLAEHHMTTGIILYFQGFFFLWWAWINFTWFASAYDTDDTKYRLLTMVQMLGSLIFAAGLSYQFSEHPIYSLGLVGFIIMRIAMIFQWLRAAKEDKKYRKACKRYALGISVVQICWIGFFLSPIEIQQWLIYVLIFAEIYVPYWAEGKQLTTTWHPHHIAERYGLLLIIVLGEGLMGISNTLKVLVEGGESWMNVIIPIGFSTVMIVFLLWWIYFQTPWGKILEKKRAQNIAFIFGYGHYFIFTSVATVGAGLELVADALRHTDGSSHAVSPYLAITVLSLSIGVFLFFNTLSRLLILGKSISLFYTLLVAFTITAIPILSIHNGLNILPTLLLNLAGVVVYLLINSWHLCKNELHTKY